jgi:CubicO group peptidase (beta-lactamase class C family)
MMRTFHPLLVALLVVTAPAAAAGRPHPHAARLDSLLSLAHRQGGFDGAALVAENGRVVFERAYGLADREWNLPSTTDTRFRIGSVTKLFTAILVMQQVQAGRLDLDAHVTDYLPEYPAENGRRITLRHLLSHTAGIPNYLRDVPAVADPDSCGHWVRYTPEGLVATFSALPLRFAPGSRFEYCNSAYVLLGVILERVTGRPYERLLHERILDPLGLKDTGLAAPESLVARRARGYLVTDGGWANPEADNPTLTYAAGALYSTVDDLFRLDRALETDALLDAPTRALMFTRVVDTPRGGYTLGWNEGFLPLPDGRRLPFVGHVGDAGGFFALFFRFPATQDLVVLLTNSNALNPQTAQGLLAGIAAILDGPGR